MKRKPPLDEADDDPDFQPSKKSASASSSAASADHETGSLPSRRRRSTTSSLYVNLDDYASSDDSESPSPRSLAPRHQYASSSTHSATLGDVISLSGFGSSSSSSSSSSSGDSSSHLPDFDMFGDDAEFSPPLASPPDMNPAYLGLPFGKNAKVSLRSLSSSNSIPLLRRPPTEQLPSASEFSSSSSSSFTAFLSSSSSSAAAAAASPSPPPIGSDESVASASSPSSTASNLSNLSSQSAPAAAAASAADAAEIDENLPLDERPDVEQLLDADDGGMDFGDSDNEDDGLPDEMDLDDGGDDGLMDGDGGDDLFDPDPQPNQPLLDQNLHALLQHDAQQPQPDAQQPQPAPSLMAQSIPKPDEPRQIRCGPDRPFKNQTELELFLWRHKWNICRGATDDLYALLKRGVIQPDQVVTYQTLKMIESLLPRLPVKAIQYTSESQDVYTCSYIPPAQVLISALSRPGILSQLLDANVPADLVATEIVHGRVARTHPYFAADQVAVKDEEEVAASGADHDKVLRCFKMGQAARMRKKDGSIGLFRLESYVQRGSTAQKVLTVCELLTRVQLEQRGTPQFHPDDRDSHYQVPADWAGVELFINMSERLDASSDDLIDAMPVMWIDSLIPPGVDPFTQADAASFSYFCRWGFREEHLVDEIQHCVALRTFPVHLCRQITSRPQACPPTVRHVKLLADLYVDAFECTQKISVSGVYLGISNLPLELRMKISEGLPCAFEPKCEDPFAHFYFLSKIVEELALLENGILVDLGTNGIVWLTVCIVVNMADMPEANALCNVLSQAATHFCRDCTIANTDVGTDQDSILNLQVKARVDMELRRKIDEINRLSQKTAKSLAETLAGMSCWPVSPLFRLKSALPLLCPQDVFHTMHGGLAKRLLLILVHLLTVVALHELDRLLRHLTLPVGEHRIPSLLHLKKWGFSDAARCWQYLPLVLATFLTVNRFASKALSMFARRGLTAAQGSEKFVQLAFAFGRAMSAATQRQFHMVTGRSRMLQALLEFRDRAFTLLGSTLIAICKFHQMLHGAEVAENFGTWSNVSTAPREALHKYNKLALRNSNKWDLHRDMAIRASHVSFRAMPSAFGSEVIRLANTDKLTKHLLEKSFWERSFIPEAAEIESEEKAAMAAAAGSSIVVHKQAATRQRKSRLAASDEVDKVLRQELIEVAALWSIPALDKAIAQHAGDDDDHEDEDGDDHVDDGLTLIRLNFVDVSISGSTLTLFRHTCVLLKDHIALSRHGAAATKFRRIEQIVTVSLSPEAAVKAAASGEPSTFVLLRVSRFVLQGDDPDLQISMFELKTRDESKEFELETELIPVDAVQALVHFHHVCEFASESDLSASPSPSASPVQPSQSQSQSASPVQLSQSQSQSQSQSASPVQQSQSQSQSSSQSQSPSGSPASAEQPKSQSSSPSIQSPTSSLVSQSQSQSQSQSPSSAPAASPPLTGESVDSLPSVSPRSASSPSSSQQSEDSAARLLSRKPKGCQFFQTKVSVGTHHDDRVNHYVLNPFKFF